jgi:hypothetical protein
MIAAASNLVDYDWQTWLVGIGRSFVGGGAGAIAGGAGPMYIDPAKFNLSNGVRALLTSMGIGFLISGIVHMAIFLQTHGAPEPVVMRIEEVSKTVPTEDGGVKQTIVTTTTQEKP